MLLAKKCEAAPRHVRYSIIVTKSFVSFSVTLKIALFPPEISKFVKRSFTVPQDVAN
jgi:hypothetical protein